MRITWGKVIWLMSFMIFLIISYNMSTFERIWDIITGNDEAIEQVSDYDPFAKDNTIDTVVVSDEEVESSVDEPKNVVSIEKPTLDIHIKVERLIWEMEQLDEELTNLKVTVSELNSEKDTTINNLVAIIGALTPFILPLVTRKFGNHNKEIISRKK